MSVALRASIWSFKIHFHRLAGHVLATAVLRLWPEAKLDIGTPTEEGFYYDFDLEHRFSPEDFEKIEAEMKKVVKENQTFDFSEKSRNEAKEYYQSINQPY